MQGQVSQYVQAVLLLLYHVITSKPSSILVLTRQWLPQDSCELRNEILVVFLAIRLDDILSFVVSFHLPF